MVKIDRHVAQFDHYHWQEAPPPIASWEYRSQLAPSLFQTQEKWKVRRLNKHDNNGRTHPDVGLLVVAEHNQALSFIWLRELVERTYI